MIETGRGLSPEKRPSPPPYGWVPFGTHAPLPVTPPLRLSQEVGEDLLPLWEQPLAVVGRGSGPISCCGHRKRCLFGAPHRWATHYVEGVRFDDVDSCDKCGAVCVAERDATADNAEVERA